MKKMDRVGRTVHAIKADVEQVKQVAAAANATAGEARQQATKVEREVVALKEQVHSLSGAEMARVVENTVETKWAAHPPVPRAAYRPPGSSAVPGDFIPSEVYVRGFYDRKSRTGALSKDEVDELGGKLLAGLPKELQQQFKLINEYEESFRLKFSTTAGREQCWKFREQLTNAIAKDDIKNCGESLTVRVQDAPDMQAKRAHFWHAVDAIKTLGAEDVDFILVPKSSGIHDASGLELMGCVTEQGYVWDEAIVKKAFPSASMIELRKAVLNKTRRR